MSTVTVKTYAQDGSEKGTTGLPDELFAQPVHEHLMWLAVKRHLGNQRQGTAKVKHRGEVSGGGRKPWKQKGTGRARSGSNTSPLWPGGRGFSLPGATTFTSSPGSTRPTVPTRCSRLSVVAVCVITGDASVSP